MPNNSFNKLVRICFSSQEFASGSNIKFKIFDKNNNLIFNELGIEWANTGVYFIETQLLFQNNQNNVYLVIAKDKNSKWKSFKTITQNSEFIID